MAYRQNKLACLTLLSGLAVFTGSHANEFNSNPVSSEFSHGIQSFAAKTISQSLKINSSNDSNNRLSAKNTVKVASRSKDYSIVKHGPWLTDGGISSNSQQLISTLKDAESHGLNPENYGLSKILFTVKKILNLDYGKGATDHLTATDLQTLKASLRRDLNRQMDDAFLRLARDLGRGVTRATKVQRQMFRDAPKINPQEWLDALRHGEISAKSALQSLMPHEAAYHRLTKHMRKLLNERTSGQRRITVADTQERAQQSPVSDRERLKRRLIQTGELPANTAVNSISEQSLQFAIESFQQRNGFPVTGIADAQTREALNLRVEDEIQAVALSLERWRWMPRILGEKHIMVNLPDYSVQVRKKGKTILSMPTVVGKVRHATPTFSEEMEYIVFNPTWTVPRSITNREMIPKERKNPGYLQSRNFDIMRRDGDYLVKVPYEEVTAADYAADRFPYVLQQRSGQGNALGNMKFMMPNPYNIYLHDTQAKELFSHHDRAYSHGCIRLNDPETMARVLLHEDGFTEQEIETALANKDRKLVRFTTPIQTHLTYMTTWVDEQGLLNSRADMYDHDEALIKALKAKNTLISNLQRVPPISAAGRSSRHEG